MRNLNFAKMLFFVLSTLLLTTGWASAEFVRITDFETLMPGPIDDQDGWYAEHESSVIGADPDNPDNQILSITTESTHLYRELLLLNADTRMLFLRFRYDSQLSISWGLSDVTYPSRFDHFEVELSLTNSTSELRINDDGTYKVLAILEPETWYNCWLLIDHADNVTQVWLHDRPGDQAYPEDQLMNEEEGLFEFRNGGINDLKNFYIKSGGGSGVSGPLRLDDFYLENTDSLNLQNPSELITSTPDEDAALAVHRLGSPHPNPFNPSVSIPFALAGPGEVTISLHDVRGRMLHRIAMGRMIAGSHAVSWDGCDDGGQRLASGVYAVRFAVDGINAGTARVVMLK